MTKRDLPKPVTVSEMLLHDIALTQRDMAAALDKLATAVQPSPAAPDDADGILLKEPADVLRNSEPGSDMDELAQAVRQIPAGFPGEAELAAEGITTLDAIPRSMKRLTAIHGIGPKTATDILQEIRKK